MWIKFIIKLNIFQVPKQNGMVNNKSVGKQLPAIEDANIKV